MYTRRRTRCFVARSRISRSASRALMAAVTVHAPMLGVRAICGALAVPRATYYRKLRPWHGPRRWTSRRALSTAERSVVLAALHEPRLCELAPAAVYATLLDEGRYLCSERTMYRVLAANREVRERRDLLRHPAYAAPELLALAPNQLWSWDITKLLGPTKWSYFCIEDARAFCKDFFEWYNLEHHHGGLALLTPHDVHHQLVDAKLAQRAVVLASAFAAHPERFVRRAPTPATPPTAAWINKPTPSAASAISLQ
jgi:hypothetical protein